MWERQPTWWVSLLHSAYTYQGSTPEQRKEARAKARREAEAKAKKAGKKPPPRRSRSTADPVIPHGQHVTVSGIDWADWLPGGKFYGASVD